MSDFSVDLTELLEAGCHFGHQARRWNPKMAKYIYTSRDGVHIIDLAQTAAGLKAACEYAFTLGKEGKQLMFVGTKRQAAAIVREEAVNAGAPFVSERWLGGIITNWEEIKRRIDKLADRKQKKASGEYAKYTKKENVLIDREISRLERLFGGMASLTQIPDALFVVDTKKEVAAIREAQIKHIPVIAMVDTNCDPEDAVGVIPVNDDAVRSIKLVVARVAQAYAQGKAARPKEESKPVAKEKRGSKKKAE